MTIYLFYIGETGNDTVKAMLLKLRFESEESDMLSKSDMANIAVKRILIL